MSIKETGKTNETSPNCAHLEKRENCFICRRVEERATKEKLSERALNDFLDKPGAF